METQQSPRNPESREERILRVVRRYVAVLLPTLVIGAAGTIGVSLYQLNKDRALLKETKARVANEVADHMPNPGYVTDTLATEHYNPFEGLNQFDSFPIYDTIQKMVEDHYQQQRADIEAEVQKWLENPDIVLNRYVEGLSEQDKRRVFDKHLRNFVSDTENLDIPGYDGDYQINHPANFLFKLVNEANDSIRLVEQEEDMVLDRLRAYYDAHKAGSSADSVYRAIQAKRSQATPTPNSATPTPDSSATVTGDDSVSEDLSVYSFSDKESDKEYQLYKRVYDRVYQDHLESKAKQVLDSLKSNPVLVEARLKLKDSRREVNEKYKQLIAQARREYRLRLQAELETAGLSGEVNFEGVQERIQKLFDQVKNDPELVKYLIAKLTVGGGKNPVRLDYDLSENSGIKEFDLYISAYVSDRSDKFRSFDDQLQNTQNFIASLERRGMAISHIIITLRRTLQERIDDLKRQKQEEISFLEKDYNKTVSSIMQAIVDQHEIINNQFLADLKAELQKELARIILEEGEDYRLAVDLIEGLLRGLEGLYMFDKMVGASPETIF